MKKIQFRTEKNGVLSLTEAARDYVHESGVTSGLLCMFITHTTAALTVTSFWDTLGHEDIQDELRRLVPTRVDFKHQHDTPEDAAGHVKSAIVGPSLTLIIEDGAMVLGHSQGIYFLEFDGPRDRYCMFQAVQDAR